MKTCMAISVLLILCVPLWADLNSELLKHAEKGNLAECRRLLEAGADVNYKDAFGWSAIISAAGRGHIDIVAFMLEKKAGINTIDISQALIAAAGRGYSNILSLLLKAGADVNAKSNHVDSALILAAVKGHNDIVALLLEAGADVNAKTNDGRAALRGAVLTGSNGMVAGLLKAGAEVNAVDGILGLSSSALAGGGVFR